MPTAAVTSAFHEIAEFFATCPTREQVLAFRPSEDLQERASELLLKSNAGELTDEERDELDEMGRAELFVQTIKARL